MFLLRRFGYRLLDSRVVLGCAAWLYHTMRRVRGPEHAEGLLSAFERRCVVSTFPKRGRGWWVNLHASRFLWRLRRTLQNGPPPAARALRRPGATRLRLGCVGRFSGLFGCPTELFEAFPPSADLYIFDMVNKGRMATYLKRVLAANYVPVDDGTSATYREGIERAAAAINAADLDLLLNIGWKRDAYDIIDLARTPCIVNYCSGSDLMHHPKVDLQLFWQPQADYFVKNHRMFCRPAKAPFSDQFVTDVTGYYDPRGIDFAAAPAWSQREPLVFFHGTLDKLANPEVLSCVLTLLERDAALNLVTMGRDDGRALSLIHETARRRGVAGRVHYEGEFDATRNDEGEIGDPGWPRALGYLRRARLFPDPWPMGGGSSLFEAYATGVPAVHMGLNPDSEDWWRRGIVEVPALRVPLGTARSIGEYEELCRKCLYDEPYATRLTADQLQTARRASDADGWWRELVASYEEWQRSSGDRSGRQESRSEP